MKHKPHEHLPLLAFGLAATPLSAIGLLSTNNIYAFELAAMLSMAASIALVMGIVKHWRYG